MKSFLQRAAFALAVSVSVAAPYTASAQPSGTLTVALPAEPATLDPHKGNTRYNYLFNSNMFEGLMVRNDKAELVPGIAESHTVSADGLTYTFTLRQGVRFHDGSPLTAEDVKFSLERATNPATKNPLLSFIRTIDKVEILDANRVALTLKEKDAIFLKKLTFAGWIVPRAYLQQVGDEGFARRPIGTGPFRFVSRSINERIEMQANEQHWGWVPKVRTLVLRTVPEDAVRLGMLQTGEADIVAEMPPPLLDRISAIRGVKTLSHPSGEIYWLVLNIKDGAKDSPLLNREVRIALNHAIDRQAIIKNVLRDQAEQIPGVLAPSVSVVDPNFKPYAYDPARARKILADAGYPNGFKIDMYGSVGRYTLDRDINLALANQLKAVGVEVNLNLWDSAKWVSDLPKKYYPMSYQAFGNTIFDPEGLMIFGVHSKAFWSFYRNENVDKLIDESLSITDQKARDAHFQKIDRAMHDDASHIFLWENKILFGIRDRVTWQPRPGDNVYKFWTASVGK
ncbi:MAG: ABC transporter substrate-binding protein [Betaproteobacteria bacterium]|nr:ABC transporter substrate-binding protein [Betaproteobacteria bacterium]